MAKHRGCWTGTARRPDPVDSAGRYIEGHEKTTPRVLRHSSGTTLAELSIDIQTIQAQLGHASSDTTERYVHVEAGKLKGVVETMDRVWRQHEARIRAKASQETKGWITRLMSIWRGIQTEIPGRIIDAIEDPWLFRSFKREQRTRMKQLPRRRTTIRRLATRRRGFTVIKPFQASSRP